MMRAGLTLTAFMIWLAFAAVPANAQNIRVSSGEHADFSRLVVAFRQPVDWTFGKVEGGFELRSNVPDVTFRLSTIFDLIPRDRIKSVTDLGEGRLFLEVSCPCFADAFALPRGQVVLDIKDGMPSGESLTFNTPLPPLPGEEKNPVQVAQQSSPDDQISSDMLALGPMSTSINPEPNSAPTNTPITLSASEIRRGLPLLPVNYRLSMAGDEGNVAAAGEQKPTTPVIPPESGSKEDALSSVSGPETAPENRVRETEQVLLEQISRGAAQGLLEADISIPILPNTEDLKSLDQEEGQPELVAQLQEVEVAPKTPESHVIIQTAIDRELLEENIPDPITEQGLRCPKNEMFDIMSWGEDIQAGVDLASYRNRLLGEFDIAQPEAISELAKYYIFLTFGAEASALLNLYEDDLEDVEYLKIMADIMNAGYSPRGSAIAQFIECNSNAAMWAVLAQENLDSRYTINGAAIVSAYSGLPVHLRRFLGPDLITRLIDAGEVDLAYTLRNALLRGEEKKSPSASYVESQLAIDEGNVQLAEENLGELIDRDAEISPEAIHDLVELKILQERTVTESEVALLASYAFEQRGTELGSVLQTLEVKALAYTSRFQEAFFRLLELEKRGELPPETKNRLLIDLAENLVTKGTDAQFLRYILPMVSTTQFPDETRLHVGQRFSDLGFFREAREILNDTATIPNQAERKQIAHLAIVEGKYNVALGYLAGLDDPQAEILRGQALAGKQDYSAAIAAYERAGETGKLLQLAWRNGLWDELAKRDGGEMGAASKLLVEPFVVPTETDGATSVLSLDVEMLARSVQTRETISRLLAQFPSH